MAAGMGFRQFAPIILASLSLVAVASPARAQESLEDVLRSSEKKRPRVAPAPAPTVEEEPAPPPPEIPYRTKTPWARTGLTAQVDGLVALGGNLLAVSEGAVLVSKDGGATWTKSAGLAVPVQSLARDGSGVVAAGEQMVMYRSANGEGGWTALPRLPGGKECTLFGAWATESVLVAKAICPDPEGVRWYRLAGGKWARVKLGESAHLEAGAASFYMVEDDGSVSTSADAVAWRRLAAKPCGFPEGARGEGQRVVVLCPGAGDTESELATSSNRGATFRTVSLGATTLSGAFVTGGGTYVMMAGLNTTSDDGASWIEVAPDPDRLVRFEGVKAVVELAGVLYAGGEKGVSKVTLPR